MKKVSFYDQIARNKRNSILLSILVFFILFLLIFSIGFVLFPGFIIIITIIALIAVAAHVSYSYNHGDKIILKSLNAKPAHDVKHRFLINTVEGLSIAAGIPKPKIYIIESADINAFATGKDPKHASVTVTTGLLEKLKRNEVEGVIGHEIAHIRNYDIKFATLVAVLVGLAAIISYAFLRSMRFGNIKARGKGGIAVLGMFLLALVLAILAPLVTRIIQAAISRKRELMADAGSAQLTRYPDGLASALGKIKKLNADRLKVSEAISHLFIADPKRSHLDKFFATHPELDERIKALRAM